ncbi:NADPH oxidase activator 1 [Gouania willdenowi]|uniref:NADPH oxidase activator 1 n=1 Tax=Gouania willdenowi TaxID=441366 RepID=UPI00105607F7|nr:NADPH oxidase activator 1-like [Gouania willdenowi]
MLYTELLKLWDESVQAIDAKDWQGALAKLEQITEPTSRTLFNAAAAHLALGQQDEALKALDFAIAKDDRLAVGFFQRAAVMIQVNRLEEALSDCIWAQKHMRGNMVIDYKQLGLRHKLFSWQVLYNAAAVYCRMNQWEQATEVLLSAMQEKGGGRGGVNIEATLERVARKEFLEPLMVPVDAVFRPRKQDVEQLEKRDFLGKAKVISSMIPNDDFGGFEPLRLQKPGFYEPKGNGSEDSRYMRVQRPYMARGPGQLTVPGGAMVFLFGEEDRDGMATVIHDGQRGLLPMSLLEPADTKATKGKKKSVPSGIPLPPELRPPGRPETQPGPIAPPRAHTDSEPPPPSYNTVTHAPPTASQPPQYTANAANEQVDADVDSVVVKVHYTYTVAVSVPLNTPYHELKERIAEKLGQPASQLRLRHKQHGSRVLTPLSGEVQPGHSMQEVAEAGRATLWCQTEDPLTNRTILYQMVALYDYASQGPEDLEFSEGETIDILGEVNEEWLEGHCAGNVGIFPSCFAYRETDDISQSRML